MHRSTKTEKNKKEYLEEHLDVLKNCYFEKLKKKGLF